MAARHQRYLRQVRVAAAAVAFRREAHAARRWPTVSAMGRSPYMKRRPGGGRGRKVFRGPGPRELYAKIEFAEKIAALDDIERDALNMLIQGDDEGLDYDLLYSLDRQLGGYDEDLDEMLEDAMDRADQLSSDAEDYVDEDVQRYAYMGRRRRQRTRE